ncbi:hypothetical protein D3C83_213080 [compost metagenome]
MIFVVLAIVLAALAVQATSGSEIDETLDRTVAPVSDPLAPVSPQEGALNAPVVNAPAPAETAPPVDDPLADVTE